MTDIISTLLYGDLSWLYLIMFLGIGFAFSTRIKVFNLIMMVACVFQGILYLNHYATVALSISWVWQPVLMFLSAAIFLFRMAGIDWFGS
jgi:hypothetical protein